jgi:hypothetical protein
MPDQGGGPDPWVVKLTTPPPPPPPTPQVELYIPAMVERVITPEQRVQIALIQVEFAEAVSAQLARSYAEIAVVLRGSAVQSR